MRVEFSTQPLHNLYTTSTQPPGFICCLEGRTGGTQNPISGRPQRNAAGKGCSDLQKQKEGTKAGTFSDKVLFVSALCPFFREIILTVWLLLQRRTAKISSLVSSVQLKPAGKPAPLRVSEAVENAAFD
jgi:hypothetical protein